MRTLVIKIAEDLRDKYTGMKSAMCMSTAVKKDGFMGHLSSQP